MTEQEARSLFAQGEEPTIRKLLEQDARIHELEAQRATDSHNSSKPPSTDGYHKPAPKSSRKKTGRKPGGQKGHPGSTLGLSENPDRLIPHPVTTCLQCGLDISTLPAEAAQYGPRIKAFGVYLKTYQLLPFKRSAELIRTLFGGTLCEGTLANMVKGVSGTLDASLAVISDILTNAKVAHFDETGSSVQGKLHWFHVASTEKVTLYAMHQRRGGVAMNEMGILPEFTGRAIHDHWKPYYTFEGCSHGLCNAHHLRELTFIHEVVGQQWALSMKNLLLQASTAVDTAKAENRTRLEEKDTSCFEVRYRTIIAEALAVNPLPEPVPGKRGRPKDSKAGNLARRLDVHREEVLAFMYDFSVPFSNNLAERDIRMMKVQQKVSGTFRSPEGATNFCRIRSYLSTACKQGRGVLAVLAKAIAGSPFMPQAD